MRLHLTFHRSEKTTKNRNALYWNICVLGQVYSMLSYQQFVKMLQKERFGDRITFENGILTVKDVKKDDGTSYFYKVGKNPQVIDVFIVQ